MMLHATFSDDSQDFVQRLDQAAQAHRNGHPGAALCRSPAPRRATTCWPTTRTCVAASASWFRQHREPFDVIDAVAAQRLDEQHG